MKKFLLFIIVLIGIGSGIGIGYGATHHFNQSKPAQVLSAKSTAPAQPTTVVSQPGIPVKVEIPSIHVNTTIESVGMDSEGRMDVPKNADNTAWFKLGYRPGANGSAVLDGHYDKVTGAPAVFWDLSKMQVGDKIIVTDDAGTKWTFAVDRTAKYPYDNFPLKEVFGSANVPKLNLITCHGTWNQKSKNYSERMVVYSTLIAQK